MFTTLPSSTRSIRGYVCISCLSSALIHHERFVPRNLPRYSSSNAAKNSSTDKSTKIKKPVSPRRARKLKRTAAPKDAESKPAGGQNGADKDAKDGEPKAEVKKKDGEPEAEVKKARARGRTTSHVSPLQASLKEEGQLATEVLDDKTVSSSSTDKHKATKAKKSGETKINGTTKTKLAKSKEKAKPAAKKKTPVEKKPLVLTAPKRKKASIDLKKQSGKAYVEEIEACDSPERLKKRNAVISRAPLQGLVKMMQSGKLDENEKALAEMFLKVRMSVRKQEVEPRQENSSSEETAEQTKKDAPGLLEQTLKFFGVGKTSTEVEEGESSAKKTKSPAKKTAGSLEKSRSPTKSPVKQVRKLAIRRVAAKRTVSTRERPARVPRRRLDPERSKGPFESVDADSLHLVPLEREMPPVPGLSYGLDRVLFNPGVYNLRDPRSRTFNFDPYLQSIMPVTEFDFNALKEYITSSRDKALISAANEENRKYTGSTSSMTSALAHFHFLLSHWRPINVGSLSKSFESELSTFSAMQRGPMAIFLRWRDGVYAIDADKQFDTSNILMMLGKSMEKLLTLPTEDFEKYRKINSDQISEEERNETESFHYTTMGDFLMRSQLDAYDPRLPGTGMFDLKTRAVVSIRMDAQNYTQGMDYEIRSLQGNFESYEREYYDMIRSAFLKYSLQVRMGRMDGIFVAYHNTQRIFGFQYISLPELDYTLHGTYDTTIGDSEFKLSIDLLNKVLDRATAKFPKQSLRLHFETRGMNNMDFDLSDPVMHIFAEPVTEEQIDEIQQSNRAEVEAFERRVLGMHNEDGSLEQSTEDNYENGEARIVLDDGKIGEDFVPAEALEEDQDQLTRDALAAEIDVEEAQDREVVGEEEGEEYWEDALGGENEEHDEIERSRLMDESHESALEEAEEVEDSEETVEEFEGEEQELIEDGNEVEESHQSAIEAEEDQEVTEDSEEAEEQHLIEEDEEHGAMEEGEEMEESDDVDEPELNEELAEETQESEEDNGSDTPVDSPSTHIPEDVEIEKPGETVPGEDQATKALEEYYSALARNFEDIPDSSLEKADQKPGIPLLAMTLTIKNKVNGEIVLRPENLTSEDKWTVEYSLDEIKREHDAIFFYNKTKARRETMHSNPSIMDGPPNEYVQELRELSRKGKAWRKEQDELDRVEKIKVYGAVEYDAQKEKKDDDGNEKK